MARSVRNLCAIGASCAAMGLAVPALGASLGVVLTEEGFPSCNRFAINRDIIQLQKNNPGPNFSLTGRRAQEITATVAGGTSLAWQATVPVNIVIVAGQGGDGEEVESSGGAEDDDDDDNGTSSGRSLVYIFGDEGATFDSDEIAPEMANIRRIRFCYGRSADFVEEELPRCAEVSNGPQCPLQEGEGEAERNGTVVFFDFDQPNFGVERDGNQCTCGNVELVGCAEGIPAGPEGACAGGELAEIPVSLDGIKNVREGGSGATTVCTTVDGKRVCKTTN